MAALLLPARHLRLLAALGLDAAALPAGVLVPAPFGQRALDLAAVGRAAPDRAPPGELAPTSVQVRDAMLRALAARDPAAAARHAAAVTRTGPLEDTLRLGALARMSALAAARAPEADDAIGAVAPLLEGPRPVARHAALSLGELGLDEGPLGRRARAVLEAALGLALDGAQALGSSADLANVLGELAELLMPGATERAGAAAARIFDLVAVLGTLAAHREGLAERLSSLAPALPPFVAPGYVVALITALGAAHPGPYLREAHAQLERAASDRDDRVRALAVEAIGRPARDVPALAEILADALTDAAPEVRTAAAFAYAELGAVPEAGVKELIDLIELESPDEALAAARALGRCGREVPARVLEAIDDPLHRATARLLAISPGAGAAGEAEAAFGALLAAYAEADLDEVPGVDARLEPMPVLAERLRAMPLARSATWLRRYVAGESEAAGEALYQALEDCEVVPRELADAGAPLVDALARAGEERAPLAALVASRLLPGDARLEALILEHTPLPVTLAALAGLERLGEGTGDDLLTIAGQPGEPHADLALAALARCAAGPALAARIAEALAAHVTEDDELAEAAHDALVELIERGVLRA
jgi:hypothetical protein